MKHLQYIFNTIQLCSLVNGLWGAWGDFFPCGKTCGGGIQLRFRKCDNPSPSNDGLQCIGDSLQSATCNDHPCKGKPRVV